MNGDKDTLRDEYPEGLIRSGVRGKYAKRYREGTNIVLIDPDLRKIGRTHPQEEVFHRPVRLHFLAIDTEGNMFGLHSMK